MSQTSTISSQSSTKGRQSRSSWVPPTHTISQSMAKWCEEVAQATANRVVCSMLPKAVSAPPATFDSVRDALADVSFGTPGYTPGRFVLTQIAELPFTGDSAEVTSVAYQRIHERYLAAVDEYKGLKVLAVFTHGPGGVYNNKRALRSLQDLQGLKFRELFSWLSNSQQAVSRSSPGDEVPLQDPTGPKGWAQV